MGRHRTARAKQKLVTNPATKLSNKRNRQKKLRGKRDEHYSEKKKEIAANKLIMDKYSVDVTRKPDGKAIFEKKLNANFLERVQRVQTSYANLTAALNEVSDVIFVLDARDPQACRSLELETALKEEGKSFNFIINKIDLVPSSSVEGWLKYLRDVSGAIAVSSLHADTSKHLIDSFLTEALPNVSKVAILGAPGVGKTTIVGFNPEKLVDTEGWQWTNCSESLAFINSVEWRGRIRELAVGFLERVQSEGLFDILNVKPQKSSGDLLNLLARKNGLSKKESPNVIIDGLKNGTYKWYAQAPTLETECELPEEQREALKAASQAPETEFIRVAACKPITADSKAIEFEIPVENPDEDEDEDFDDNEEEQNNEEEEDAE